MKKGTIDDTVRAFFRCFDNRDGTARVEELRSLLSARAAIIAVGGDQARVMDVEEFIGPRQVLLGSGELSDFHEWETQGKTFRFGGLALRISRYEKRGRQGEAPYEGSGWKVFLLHQSAVGWTIGAFAWADASTDLPLDEATWQAHGPSD